MKFTICFLWILFLSQIVFAQKIIVPREKSSPLAMATYKNELNDLYIKVTYGQPYKRNRLVFGGIIPYGKIWRTGANEATELTISQDIMVGDTRLKTGTYTVFTVPGSDKWSFILNTELGQWGSTAYEEFKDRNILLFEVKPGTSEYIYEALTIEFDEVSGGVDMVVVWDNTEVKLPFKFIQ